MRSERGRAAGRSLIRTAGVLVAISGLALLVDAQGRVPSAAPHVAGLDAFGPSLAYVDASTASSDLAEPGRFDGATRHGDIRFVPGRAGFSVGFRDVVTPYRIFLLTASPGERLRLRAIPGDDPVAGVTATGDRFAAVASRARSRRPGGGAPGTGRPRGRPAITGSR